MSNLYNVIANLCEEKGITAYRLCKDLNMRPSVMSDLKSGRKQKLRMDTADKIASYFGVSVGYLLGNEQKEKPAPYEGNELHLEIGPAKRRLLEMVDDMSDEEMAVLMDRIKRIKESRV